MPKLTTIIANNTCFLCGSQAYWVSFNSKQMRCVEKITQCPGHAKKAEESRQKNISKEDRRAHMTLMSKNGNKRLVELHNDEQWRRNKGNNISKSKITIPADQKPNWVVYKNTVDRITRESWIYHYNKINPNNLSRGCEYELDHMYSKHQGFLNNVPPEVIGHYSNLQMIPRRSNRVKYNKCSITLEDLFTACTR
tara:strand:- start:1289 stop:1873 length:585 start_codon:yes stop_codon:yes gene_type:complete